MSAFEVVITPTRAKCKKRVESREPTEVIMAPFSAKAVVQFEDVPVGRSAKRILRIVNPTEDEIKVKVTKAVNAEYNVSINWTEMEVPALGEAEMEMVWNPVAEVTCTETMQLLDDRNFRKNVMIIMKTRSSKPTKTIRKFPTVSSSSTHVRTLRLKSPTGPSKSNKLNLPAQRKCAGTQVRVTTKTTRAPMMKPAWKASTYQATSRKQHDTVESMTINVTHTSPLIERNIYVHSHANTSMLNDSPYLNLCENDTLKENISPLTPNNVMKLIDNIKFTPINATAGASHACEKFDNLASWPTPVNTNYVEVNLSEVRPRRLTAAELADEAAELTQTTTLELKMNDSNGDGKSVNTMITNKTFEIKGTAADTAALDISAGMLDGSLSCAVTLNKTTTIINTPVGRPLAMIQEEEADSSTTIERTNATSLQKTYVKCSESTESGVQVVVKDEGLDLKRDIKLVGTPLRKYSESMKDLSLKSPQCKFKAVQGSMPNLNEMECIRSIEQNRYFYQRSSSQQQPEPQENAHLSVIEKQSSASTIIPQQPKLQLNDSTDGSSCSEVSTTSHLDVMFNQSEILAQSSRFNINEVGLKSRRNSPVSVAGKWRNLRGASPKGGNSLKQSSKGEHVAKYTQKRNLHDISLSDSPSSESLVGNTNQNIVCNSNNTNANAISTRKMLVSPPKRQRIDNSFNFTRPAPASGTSSFNRSKSWSRTLPMKLKLVKPTTPRKATQSSNTPHADKLYDPELYLQTCINPDPFAASTTCDPFLTSTMYLDEQAVERHQQDFKKWLNALVTIPADLDTNSDVKIDVGKLFSEVRHKELTLAPTKEEQSMDYLILHRLESVRRAAVQLYLSEELRVPCSKVAVYVNKNAIRIRNDRNLHLDVVMQRYILELLLCFNPLWLRLGLEVVYGEKIHLRSNSDVVGLSTFILNRLFRDKFLEERYSRAYSLSDEYADYVKKHTLTKMLCLLLFLDKAKQKRIIKYNPCLFVKKSPHKETKDILLKFSSELLANMGDITRDLKRLGYVLEHKQTFLDEFDYAFNNLAVDLRDGIRLTRVMEIILLRDGLSRQLRVPAISRLQRIFNVNLGLRALSEANFELRGEITAADIVDGHREKTLSLLWQIIYKFRSPKFHAAACVLQQWWRRLWLRVFIQRRIRDKKERQRQLAAARIQAFYHGYITRRYVHMWREERTRAALVLQKHVRRHLAQKRYKRNILAATCIQRWYRAILLGACYRKEFLVLRCCTLFLQRCYRRRLLSRKLLLVATEYKLQREQRREAAAACIQRCWHTFNETKKLRTAFLCLRKSATVLQRQWRAKRAMQQACAEYQRQKKAIIWVQQHFRANRSMAVQRTSFMILRKCAIQMQRRRRATLCMRLVRVNYLELRYTVIKLQRRRRATLAMRLQRDEYLRMRNSVCILQRQFRAHYAMRQAMETYKRLQDSTICIQRKWRATRLARRIRVDFISMQYYATVVQQKFRATCHMRKERAAFVELRHAVMKVQRRYRALRQMRIEQAAYQVQRGRIINLQRRFRAILEMRADRSAYKRKQLAALQLQRWYRATMQARQMQHNFRQLRNNCLCIQRRWRATLAARQQREQYVRICQRIVWVQRKWRATLCMRRQRQQYMELRKAAVVLQRQYRAHRQMLIVRSQYLLIRTLIICIQRKFRAHKLKVAQRRDYLLLRRTTIHLQEKFRGRREMKVQRADYMLLRRTVVHLQQKFRGRCETRQAREKFLYLRSNVISFQARARGYLARQRLQALMTPEFLEQRRRKKAARVIQRFWRGHRVRQRFQSMKLRMIRRNIAMLRETSQAVNSISNKMRYAVRILRDHSSASEMLHVLMCLDRLSRNVPHMLVEHIDFMSTFCYGIMAQTIRSEVDKQLIRYCSRIILNLARYNSTTANTFQENGLVTIAQMLLRWCDKDNEIFNTLCTLIWLFAHCPKKRQIIREFMTTSEAIYVVRETKKLVARKERMLQNLRKPHIVTRSNEQQSFSSRALPGLEPDYGVIHNKPYTFISSVYAFDTLLAKLEIDIY